MRDIALTDQAPRNDDHDRVAARLADMRRTLGDEAFDGFVRDARHELDDLARQAEPWSPAQALRGLNIAMLLGFERLEGLCRDVVDGQPSIGLSPLAAAAAATLHAARP